MNPASYTEPKFPPPDEYSQSNYIPAHNSEYYRQNYSSNSYGYNDNHRRYEDDKFTPIHYTGYHNEPVSPTSPSPPIPAHRSGDMNGYSTPSESPSPPAVPSPGDDEASPKSSCAQQQADGQPIIYPWMRKSQGTNPGKKTI